MAEIKSIVYACDNPKCCAVLAPEEVDHETGEVREPAHGYHISNVFHVHLGGGDSVDDVFACDEQCIEPAILEALRRAR